MSVCFTEVFRVSSQFVVGFWGVFLVPLVSFGGILLRAKVAFVEQVTYALLCSGL